MTGTEPIPIDLQPRRCVEFSARIETCLPRQRGYDVDLALVNVMKSIEAVRRCLRAGKVPKRSWVQFFDSDWGAEWVGVYKNTPAPPMTWDAE